MRRAQIIYKISPILDLKVYRSTVVMSPKTLPVLIVSIISETSSKHTHTLTVVYSRLVVDLQVLLLLSGLHRMTSKFVLLIERLPLIEVPADQDFKYVNKI